ncbi:PNC1 [Candida oxycetoniae]|uniref:nicotinamidase n=1 Tax=Candida oxycetoniae TaxID=497107 RepID=A0AAI9T1B9_9ASCO|nr:PNC1 [Candida oxycetoniae]KAI3406602.2 PNC1 [Candida oxycetoniae]
MTKRALVVIDLQEDFLPPNGSLAIQDGRTIVPAINELLCESELKKWDLVVASQDWHPANHTSFASQHAVSPFTELEFQNPETGETKTQVVWPDHCIQGTHGACFAPSFANKLEKVQNGAISKAVVIKKGYLQDREYYSCFQDSWGLHHTEMKSVLETNKIDEAVFVGLAYDYCVMHSAIDCAKSGFKTYVVKSLCKSVDPEKINDTDEMYRINGVIIVDSISEIID